MIEFTLGKIAAVVNATHVQYLNEEKQIEGVSIDSRLIEHNNLYVPLIGERVNGHSFVIKSIQSGAAASLWQNDQPSPPKNIPLIFVNDAVIALQKLAQAYRDTLDATFIGITGSSGKTSTKDIVYSVSNVGYDTEKTFGNKNNEIGLPLTILQLKKETQVAVIEMGISDFKEMGVLTRIVKPHVAIITSISESHIDNLKTMQNIVIEKLRIVEGLQPEGLLVYNADTPYLDEVVRNSNIRQKIFSYGFSDKAQSRILNYRIATNGLYFTSNLYGEHEFFLPLLGKHQILNAMASLLVGMSLALEAEEVQEGFNKIELTSMRNEVKKIGSSVIIDDTYNANPDSMIASLDTLGEYPARIPKIAVLGDMFGLGDNAERLHRAIGARYPFKDINELWVIGPYCEQLAEEVLRRNLNLKVRPMINKEQLYEELIMQTQQVSLILIKASRGMALDEVVTRLKEISNNAQN